MGITRLSIPDQTRAGDATNAYLVGADAALLVDPAGRTDELDGAVARRDVAHVAVTHAHGDHVGAVAAYADATGATVWARDGFEDRFERAAGIAPDRTFREGTAVGPATALETPGHAPDHVAFDAGDAALVGDLAVAEGSVFVGVPDGDIADYLDSLRRLLELDADVLYPGHGGPIDDPRATVEGLIDHRLDREEQVRGAVDAGARTPEEVVDGVYDRDLGDMRDLATRQVEAHLEKLAGDGALEWDGERARPR